ncbi:MAG: type II toxin-antitoxin system Phd/YefM family antitoxin [Capsulimonadaceae bacterium]|nr:type II toxin-antitoxin system Phd/YefM family antitoxin [Capsulimonadaceae bacterium]
MLKLKRDIRSLTDFKRNTADYMQQLKETKRPVVLTVNGKAEIVVQDADSYQDLLDKAEQMETIEGIRRGLEDMRTGQMRPAAEVFADMRRKLNLG